MKKIFLSFSVLAVALSLCVHGAFAADTGNAKTVGRISAIEGEADLLSSDQSGSLRLKEGSVISEGDTIRTKGPSKAEVTFSDKSVVRIGENSKLEISLYDIGDDGRRIDALLDLNRGKIRAVVSKSPAKDNFKIKTPNAVARIAGTDLFVSFQKSATSVVVVDGKVSVANATDESMQVAARANQAVLVQASEPPAPARDVIEAERKIYEADTRMAGVSAAAAEGYSAPGEMKAVITKISGGVKVKSKGSKEWHCAKVNDVLMSGDSVDTGNDGRAEIRLDNNNIIVLQQNTDLDLEKLTVKGNNGEYENLLGTSHGKLRAQVQKLKGNSKFEVKTPTAVAAVRGTILFLNIQSNHTSAYFEEGNGLLRNLFSGATREVPDGTSASAFGDGSVSNPAPVTDNEKSSWHEGWTVSPGTGEPSGPGGNITGNNGGEGNNPGNNDGQGIVFDSKPFTDDVDVFNEDNGEEPSPSPSPSPSFISGSFSGTFIAGEPGDLNYLRGTLGSAASAAEWDDDIITDLNGTYSYPISAYQSSWYADAEASGSSGSYNGYLAGILNTDEGTWDGVMSAIYVDSTGMAGLLWGDLSGTATAVSGESAITGTMTGSGTLDVSQMAEIGTGGYTIVDGEEGNNSLMIVEAEDSGAVIESSSSFTRYIKNISGQDWGVWRESLNITYTPAEASNWWGWGRGYNDYGYSVSMAYASDSIQSDLTDLLRLDIYGYSLTEDYLRSYDEEFYGVLEYGDGYYTGNLSGVGKYESIPVIWSQWLGTEKIQSGYYYYNTELSEISADTYHYGLIGALSLPFTGKENLGEFWAMGETHPSDGKLTWGTWFEYSYTDDGDVIPYATVIGRTNSDSYDDFNLQLVGLYVDSSGNAGILTGTSLEGEYISYVDMWIAYGLLATEKFADGYTTTDNTSWGYYWTAIDGTYEGSFDGTGSITAGNDIFYYGSWGNIGSYTCYLYKYVNDEYLYENWGTYSLELGGTYDYGETESPDNWTLTLGGSQWDSEKTYWIADIDGTNWDTDNYVYGSLSGRYLSCEAMGSISGVVIGNYSGDTWVALSTGIYTGDKLTFSGIWNRGGGLYCDSSGSIAYAGADYGIIGATVSPWDGGLEFLAMGEYNYDDSPETSLRILNNSIISYSNSEENYVSEDGSAFYGFAGGIWGDGGLNGSVVAIYVDPSGSTAGILRGYFSGSYYSGIGMWEIEGILPATLMADDLELDPESIEMNSEPSLSASMSGNFGSLPSESESIVGNENPSDSGDPGEGITCFIPGQGWGIYSLKIGGGSESNYYTNSTGSKVWMSTISGSGQFGSNSAAGLINGDIYGIYDVTGDGEGTESGNWVATSVGTWSFIDDNSSGNHYYGLTGGIWDGDEITGKMVALYGIPELASDYVDFDGAPFTGYGLSAGTYDIANTDFGNLAVTSVSGIDPNIIGENWGIWALDFDGSVSEGGESQPAFKLTLGGSYICEESVGGYWIGVMAGIEDADTGITSGAFRGIWLDVEPDSDECYYSGKYTGDVTGIITDGSWEGVGLGEWVSQVWVGTNPSADGLGDFIGKYIDCDAMEGSGYGTFDGTGVITFDTASGETLGLKEEGQDSQGWGIYYLSLSGDYSNPQAKTGWSGVVGGKDSNVWGDSYWLIRLSGTWQDGVITADAGGTCLSDDSLTSIEGKMYGLADGDAETWEGVSVGSWADTDLSYYGELDSGAAFGYYDISEREVYLEDGSIEGLLGGTGSFDWTGDSSTEVSLIGQFSNSSANELWGIDFSGTTTDEAAFMGTVGGTDVDDSLDGRLIALYIRPSEGCYETGYIISTSDGISGDFYSGIGMFEAYGDLVACDMGTTTYTPDQLYDGSEILRRNDFAGIVSGNGISGTLTGESLGIRGQDWDIWRIGCGGTFTDSSSGWKAAISGRDDEDGEIGPWIAIVNGNKWSDNQLSATVTGVTLDYYDGGFMTGSLDGELIGTYDTDSWEALSMGVSDQADFWVTEDVDDITDINIIGKGLGYINDVLSGNLMLGQVFAADGTYEAILAGTGNVAEGDEWSLAIGANILDESGDTSGYLLAADRNDWESGNIIKGVYFIPSTESGVDTFEMGSVTGNISNISNLDTTWTATSSGEWVDLTELATSALGFDQTALADMISVPVTETYSALLTGSGSFTAGGQINVEMDLSMYANSATALSGIWSSIINGTYTGSTSNTWSASVGDSTVTLTGSQWSDGQWIADVTGTVNSTVITGQAGGTYADGTLTGVGAGTWTGGK
jgi:hypothetical protein